MKFKSSLALVFAASMLTACYSSGPGPGSLPPTMASLPPSNSVDGSWVDPNGIVSTFQAGAFTTRSTDSNTLLASGTYVSRSPTLVEINMTSLVRNTQSRVNCALATPYQLNCTTDSGSQFSLSRRG